MAWSTAVVLVNADAGDSTIAAVDAARLQWGSDAGDAEICVLYRDGGPGEDAGAADPESADGTPPTPIEEALQRAAKQMDARRQEGLRKKEEAAAAEAATAAAAAEAAADDDAEEGTADEDAGQEGVMVGEGVAQEAVADHGAVIDIRPDIIYVLSGFMLSEKDAQHVLGSDVAVDAVLNLRLPAPLEVESVPTEEELQAEAETAQEFCRLCLRDCLSSLYGGGAMTTAALRGLLERQLVEEEGNGLGSSFRALNLDAARLAAEIAQRAPADDGQLQCQTGSDANTQAESIVAQVLTGGDAVVDFRLRPLTPADVELQEAAVTQYGKHFVAEQLPPGSHRNSVVWDVVTFEYDSDAVEAATDGDAVLEQEELNAAKESTLVARVRDFIGKFALEVINQRAEYAAYVQTLHVASVDNSARQLAAERSHATYYDMILEDYEATGRVGVLHVVYAMVEDVAETADESQAWGGNQMKSQISDFLRGTAKGGGVKGHAAALAMTALMPVPGRHRAGMPAVPSLANGEREAFATSLYKFMPNLHPCQVERALLREEFGRLLRDESNRIFDVAEMFDASWDDHLSARLYEAQLNQSEMAIRYQDAISTAGPDVVLSTAYYSRTDQLLVALHTPMALQPGCVVRSRDACGVDGIPNIAEWKHGIRPAACYALHASKRTVVEDRQSAYLMDSGMVVRTTVAGKHSVRAYVSGHVLSSTVGSGTFTAALADGSILAVRTRAFQAASGEQFDTVTFTNPEGQAVVLNGNGSVTVLGGAGSNENSQGLEAPHEQSVSVVSKGSVVKHYPDGCVSIAYRTGDTSEYIPDAKSWFDMTASGCRQRRHDGVRYDQYRTPDVVDRVDTCSFVDHETNADVRSRSDRVQTSQRTDGSTFVQHADGVQMNVAVGCVDVNLPDKDLRVKVASSDTEVKLGGGGSMQLTWPTMHVSSTQSLDSITGPHGLIPTKVVQSWSQLDSKSTIVVKRPDGTTCKLRDGVVHFAPNFPGGNTYTYNLNPAAESAFSATDGLSTTVTVQQDGELRSTISTRTGANDKAIRSHAPRLFVVNTDGSGKEWLDQSEAEDNLAAWHAQGRLLQSVMPNETPSRSLTVENDRRRIAYHPALTPSQRAAFILGVEQFATWSAEEKAAADALVVVEQRTDEEMCAEKFVQERARAEEVDAALTADVIAEYNPAVDVVESADEYYAKIDINSDGCLTAAEMRTQLADWGIVQPLEQYIGLDPQQPLSDDDRISRGNFYTFYFPAVALLQKSGIRVSDVEAQVEQVVGRYAASADMRREAQRLWIELCEDSAGQVLRTKVQRKLSDWGFKADLGDFVQLSARRDATDASAVLSKAEWFEFYLAAFEALRPLDKDWPPAAIPSVPQAPSAATADGSGAQYFLVHPRTVDFGIVIQGCKYRQPLSMTNVTASDVKFRIRQPANQAVRLVHGQSSVPPGQTCMLEVELNAGDPGKTLEPIEIVCEEQVFRLKVSANVKLPPQVDFHPYGTGARLPREPLHTEGRKAAQLRAAVAQS
jgi:hypothetical protein